MLGGAACGPRGFRQFGSCVGRMGDNRGMTAGRDAKPAVGEHDLADTDWVAELATAVPPGRRVYADGYGHLVKVQVPTADPTASTRNNDLVGEARLLRLAEGIPGIPAVSFVVEGDGWQALGTPFVTGARSALAVESLRTRARVAVRVGHLHRHVSGSGAGPRSGDDAVSCDGIRAGYRHVRRPCARGGQGHPACTLRRTGRRRTRCTVQRPAARVATSDRLSATPPPSAVTAGCFGWRVMAPRVGTPGTSVRSCHGWCT